MVEPSVYEAMSKPIVGLMDPYFFELANGIRTDLQSAFGTRNEMTLAISGTGSAGMEAAVSNFATSGAKMAILAKRILLGPARRMGRRYGANVVRLEKAWGKPSATTKPLRSSSRKNRTSSPTSAPRHRPAHSSRVKPSAMRPIRPVRSSLPIVLHRWARCNRTWIKRESTSPIAARKKD